MERKTRQVCTGHLCHTHYAHGLFLKYLVTWLAGLLHLLGHTSHQLGHDLGSSDLFLGLSLPLPQVAMLGRLQQKHVVHVERGANWLHLCVCVFQMEGGRESLLPALKSSKNTLSAPIKTNLNSTSAFGGAFAYVVESNAGWFSITVLAGPTQVDHQGFILEQADQVRRLLALRDTDLRPDRSRLILALQQKSTSWQTISFVCFSFLILPGLAFDPVNHPEPRLEELKLPVLAGCTSALAF